MHDRLVYLAYAAGWGVVRRMPERLAYGLFRRIADVAWRRRGAGVRQLEANLRRVVGPDVSEARLRALSRAGMRSYLRYWCDTFRLAGWPAERIVGTVDLVGLEHYRRALDEGCGVVLALPHMGNWDHSGAWSTLEGGPVTTVAERLRPERLYDRFVGLREALGMEVLPLDGDAGATLVRLAEATRENRVVALLGDRDLRATGVPVTFFGEPATMPPGPALVAMRTGAPLHAATVSYTPRGIRLRFHDRIEVPSTGTTRERVTAVTQALADAYAEAIAEHPQDWHMLQPLWTADQRARETA